MTTPMTVKAEPCLTCPYRKDVPSGVWHEEEYEKLRGYDDNTRFELFLCHQSTLAGCEIVCKGWLMVHEDSVAVRLALMRGNVTPEAFTQTEAELHASGNAAADFGERDIEQPQEDAQRAVSKLNRTGRFRTS